MKEIFPNCYDASAAFHVTFGETYADAAHRELKEETGISTELRYVAKFKHHDSPEHQFVAVFIGVSDSPVKIDRSKEQNTGLLGSERLKMRYSGDNTYVSCTSLPSMCPAPLSHIVYA